MPTRESAVGQRLKCAMPTVNGEELEIGDRVIVDGLLKGKITRIDEDDPKVFYIQEEDSGKERRIEPHFIVSLVRKGTVYGLLKSIGGWGGQAE